MHILYIYTYTGTYIHIYIHTYICLLICVYTYKRMLIYTCVFVYVLVYMLMQTSNSGGSVKDKGRENGKKLAICGHETPLTRGEGVELQREVIKESQRDFV